MKFIRKLLPKATPFAGFLNFMVHVVFMIATVVAFNFIGAQLEIGADYLRESATWVNWVAYFVVLLGQLAIAYLIITWFGVYIGLKWAQSNKAVQQIVGLQNQVTDLLQEKQTLRHTLMIHNANFERIEQIEIARRVDARSRHFDDWALDQFVEQMRATLKAKRDKGFAGWNDNAEIEALQALCYEQNEKAEPNYIHVANYAMFCWMRDAFPAECEAGEYYLPVAQEKA